jgi:hypothetical protein
MTLVVPKVLGPQPKHILEPFTRFLKVLNNQAKMMQPDQVHHGANRLPDGIVGINPAPIVRLNQLDCEPRQLVGIYERFVAVLAVEDGVFEYCDALLSQAGYITLDVVCLDCDVFKALPAFFQELKHPRTWLPILDQVEPTLIAEQDSSVELLPSSLIVTEVACFQAEDALEPAASVVEILYHDTNMLNA